MTGTPSDAEVSSRVHTLVGYFARRNRWPDPEDILAATRPLLQAAPLGKTWRSGRRRVAMATATYLTRLAPPADWTFLGAEQRLVRGGRASRLDLVWASPAEEVLVHELKVTTDPWPALPADTLEQVVRYSETSLDSFGERFVGVSAVHILHPTSSFHLHPDGTLERLADTRFWFDPDSHCHDDATLDAYLAMLGATAALPTAEPAGLSITSPESRRPAREPMSA